MRPPTPGQCRRVCGANRVGPRGRRRRPAGAGESPVEKPGAQQMRRTGAPPRTHARAERDEGRAWWRRGAGSQGPGGGGSNHTADDQKRALLRCSAGGASGGTAGGRRDPGGRCRSWASWAKGATKLALFAGRRLMLIMGGPRGALVAPLPQCRSEHHLDDEIFEACLSLRGRMRFCTTSQAASLHVEPMFHPEPARRRGGNR
jgi:hypothetical protein